MKAFLVGLGQYLKQPTTIGSIVAGAAYFGMKIDAHSAITVLDLIVAAASAAGIVYDETRGGKTLSAALGDAVGPLVKEAVNDLAPGLASAVAAAAAQTTATTVNITAPVDAAAK